jgi:SAM-dependent methyltransferase
MTNLRNLVKYKQMVESIDFDTIRRNINSSLSEVSNDLDLHDFDVQNLKDSMLQKHLMVLNILEDWSLDLNTFREEIHKQATTLEEPYYEKSNEIYTMRMNDSVQEKMDRQIFNNILYNEEFNTLLQDRIRIYADSQYAGLQLAPGNGDITNLLVCCNPLYLIDDSDDMFRHIRNWREPAYQRRLRYYTVDEKEQDILKEMPRNQLGLIVALNWFNFRPMKIIKKYLQSMMQVLRPGGVIIFTYNNCDYPKAIDKVDEMYYCYSTSKVVKDTCIQLGYEIINSFDKGYDELDMGISWLEIKKPGTRNTIRRSETMGHIKNLGEN